MFPSIFKGVLEARVTDISDEIKIAAAKGIASLVKEGELSEDYIVPSAFYEGVCDAIANAVKGVIRE